MNGPRVKRQVSCKWFDEKTLEGKVACEWLDGQHDKALARGLTAMRPQLPVSFAQSLRRRDTLRRNASQEPRLSAVTVYRSVQLRASDCQPREVVYVCVCVCVLRVYIYAHMHIYIYIYMCI